MNQQQPLGILYIDRNSLSYYEKHLSTVVTFPFPQTLVRDIEVINKTGFEEELTNFIKTNNIPAVEAVTILAEQLFLTKDFINISPQEQDQAVQHYIDTVPFEMLSTKIYSLGNGARVIATNRDFFECIKSIFEKAGFVIHFIVPAQALRQTEGNGFDASFIQTIYSKSASLKQESLLLYQEQNTSTLQNEQSVTKTHPLNKRLLFLIGFFVLLVGILIFVIINQG